MSPRLPRSCPSTSTVRRYALSFLASVRVGDDFVTWCVRESGKTLLLLSTFHCFGVALQEGLWVASATFLKGGKQRSAADAFVGASALGPTPTVSLCG